MSDKLTDSEKWTPRQLAKYLEENPDVRVEIDKDDIGKTDGVLTDSELEQMTGFVICEFPPDNDPCESCGEPNRQLYYHGPADAATYLCKECVVRLYEKNLEWGKEKAMSSVLDMVKDYLVTHGHDGLYSTCGDEPCGCGVNDLAPCGEINEFCVAAKKVDGMFYPAKKEKAMVQSGCEVAKCKYAERDDTGKPVCGYEGDLCIYRGDAERIAALERERDELKEQLECERMRLTACGVAAMANTEESRNAQLISKDNPYFSASYQDVLDAVEREMKLRTDNALLRKRLEPIESTYAKFKDYPLSAISKRNACDRAIRKCMEGE